MIQGESDPVLRRAVEWADAQPHVRALILESSRAAEGAPLDELSDYDLLLVVTSVQPFQDDDSWIAWWGTPLVRFNQDVELGGYPAMSRLALYEDGLKVDHIFWQVEYFREQVARPRLPDLLDVGYRVLLDKDGIAADLKPATYTAHIPAQPTEAEYLRCVHEFWWETCYVAKNIWRDELFQMKYSFDAVIKFQELRLMLEWHAEIDHGWSARPGAYGRGLKKLLRPDVWVEVEATFVGAGTEENWEALFRTGALFRRIAVEVAEHLGYAYPHEMDAGMVAYWERVRALPRGG